MSETVVTALVDVLIAYGGAGLVFAVIFLSLGVERVDAGAKGAGLGFRLLILPGVAAFWPLFSRRWVRGVSAPPAERTPHRRSGAL
jgi:hypothetical protein